MANGTINFTRNPHAQITKTPVRNGQQDWGLAEVTLMGRRLIVAHALKIRDKKAFVAGLKGVMMGA
jgi:hypothetical protein